VLYRLPLLAAARCGAVRRGAARGVGSASYGGGGGGAAVSPHLMSPGLPASPHSSGVARPLHPSLPASASKCDVATCIYLQIAKTFDHIAFLKFYDKQC